MKHIGCTLTALLAMVLVISGCERNAFVAKVGGQTISAAALLQELEHAGLPASKQNLELLLGRLITQHAAEYQAKALNLDEDPDYRRKVRLLSLEVLRERYKQQVLQHTSLEVTEAEITSAYEQHQTRFFRPAKARVALIVFERSAQDSAKRVAEYLDELRTLEGDKRDMQFQRLAANHSMDRASRYRGGDIGYLVQGEQSHWPAAVVEQAFTLTTVGELSPVIEANSALYIVKLVEHQAAFTEPLAAVRSTLRQELAAEKFDAIKQRVEAKLLEGLAVDRNEALLASLRLPSGDSTSVELPGPALK
ncbi:peptidylprolyl isomerase [Exilibacterium tricleocarpae]|nr:peptidyl-prolyl cis-trans isomerase [Exilibacterium tricleocarpae]